MLRTIVLASLTALSALTSLRAQEFGAPQWSNVPYTENGKAPWFIYGPYCVDDASYTLADIALGKEQYVGYIYPLNGPAVRREVIFPKQKGHKTFSTFCMVGDKPSVVYTIWDKKTDVVTAFIQAYSATGFDPEGAPLKLCDLPLSKAYDGSTIYLRAMPSPDRSKILFLFDDIQEGGIKLALCWVMDNEFNPLWNGAYRIPMQVYGSTASSYFMDNGDLYMKVHGVALTEDNVKEKSDGSLKAKPDAKYWKHSDSKWYNMHGDAFREWDCSVPALAGGFTGFPMMVDGHMTMVGLMMPEDEKSKEERSTYVMLRMNDDFGPEVVTSGSMDAEPADYVGVMKDQVGNIFITLRGSDGDRVLKLNKDGEKQWERTQAQGMWGTNAIGDQLFNSITGTTSTMDDLLAGKKAKGSISNKAFPICYVRDAEGKITSVKRIFPEDAKLNVSSGLSGTLDACGCYYALSDDKQRPGIVRVCVEK